MNIYLDTKLTGWWRWWQQTLWHVCCMWNACYTCEVQYLLSHFLTFYQTYKVTLIWFLSVCEEIRKFLQVELKEFVKFSSILNLNNDRNRCQLIGEKQVWRNVFSIRLCGSLQCRHNYVLGWANAIAAILDLKSSGRLRGVESATKGQTQHGGYNYGNRDSGTCTPLEDACIEGYLCGV